MKVDYIDIALDQLERSESEHSEQLGGECDHVAIFVIPSFFYGLPVRNLKLSVPNNIVKFMLGS